MELIDGKAIARKINDEARAKVAQLKRLGVVPGLAVVLVGDNPASVVYVRNKDRTSQELGLYSRKIELETTKSQVDLMNIVEQLNSDPEIHGILVQSPLQPHLDEGAIVYALNPAKDVDGLHPVNVGKLAIGDPTALVSCTPLGCQRLLLESGIDPAGAHVVIVGRSMLVGKPLALLLMQKRRGGDATGTVAHSRSRDLTEITRSADILVAAIGRGQFFRADHFRNTPVVLHLRINRMT